MPCFEEHCRESLSLFGKSYAEVHLWLDEFAGTEKYGFRHRKVRHHGAGIAEACRLFGQEAGAAARQHIISDLKTDGWGDGDQFPKDENDYVKIGFF